MMKMCKILLFYIVLILCFNFANIENFSYAKTQSVRYAKVLNGCLLYKSQDLKDDIDNVYFVVPESYFVTILEDVNDNAYKVQYDKYIGYVKCEFVSPVTFVPDVKTLTNIKCDIKQTSGTQIWNKPSADGNVLAIIPAGEIGVSYISYVFGEIPTGGEINVWYYILYTPSSNLTNVYEGYVYSENVTNLTDIPVNLEDNPELYVDGKDSGENNVYISSTFKTVIVALISIPIILLISIILYKLVKFITKYTNKNKNANNYNYEKSNLESDFKANDLSSDEKYSSIKTEIDNMRNKTYHKKLIRNNNNKRYPTFPIYDSEDDLL